MKIYNNKKKKQNQQGDKEVIGLYIRLYLYPRGYNRTNNQTKEEKVSKDLLEFYKSDLKS